MNFMKITKLQKNIIFSTFGLILAWRAIRYTYLKTIQEIFVNGNQFGWISLLNSTVFVLGIVVLVASVIGFWHIIREIADERRREVVSERFMRLFSNSFWTLIVSIVIALVVKILIWP